MELENFEAQHSTTFTRFVRNDPSPLHRYTAPGQTEEPRRRPAPGRAARYNVVQTETHAPAPQETGLALRKPF